LDLSYGLFVNDEMWGDICDSLETHPTLEVLILWSISAPAVIKSQIQALVDMMKVNTTIHTIQLSSCYTHHELFRGSVIPYLETNRFRPRVRAIQRTRPIPSSTATIAAAANLPDTSTTATATSTANVAAVATSVMSALTTTATSSLPTATVAATDAATSATTPSNASTSDAFAHTVAVAAANVATPPAGQKRKARP
jgi:hypothetical protein